MRYLALIPMFLLMCQLIHSQYPKKMIIGNDTIVALSKNQVDKINVKLVELDLKVNEVNYLTDLVRSMEHTDRLRVSEIANLRDQLSVMDNDKELYEMNMKLYESKYKSIRKRSLIIGGVGVTIGVIGIIALIAR